MGCLGHPVQLWVVQGGRWQSWAVSGSPGSLGQFWIVCRTTVLSCVVREKSMTVRGTLGQSVAVQGSLGQSGAA